MRQVKGTISIVVLTKTKRVMSLNRWALNVASAVPVEEEEEETSLHQHPHPHPLQHLLQCLAVRLPAWIYQTGMQVGVRVRLMRQVKGTIIGAPVIAKMVIVLTTCA